MRRKKNNDQKLHFKKSNEIKNFDWLRIYSKTIEYMIPLKQAKQD